jgi:acetylornithine deacetylase
LTPTQKPTTSVGINTVLPIGLPWVTRLVEINTVSRNSNLGLIEVIRDNLKNNGIDPILSFHPSENWANLFATIPAHDGSIDGGVVLSGHTDVVPVEGQDWDSDPFKPDIRDGNLYGRGTCDMKGYIGTVLALVPAMQRANLTKPLHLAFSFDEEVTCVGAPLMLEDLARRGIKPDGCIIGEPTGMRPVVAHKGVNAYRCCVQGHAAHSSLTPRGLNAIEYAAKLICFIRDMADQYRAQGPFDQAYDVPFTTAQTSTIAGGNAINTVPAECCFEFEFRNLPAMDSAPVIESIRQFARQSLIPEMRKTHPEASIEFETLFETPGFDASEKAAISQLIRALTADHEKRKVAYGTEAGLFQQAGIPTVVCGPGAIEQAHRANEFVSLDQLIACEHFVRRVIKSMSVESG